MKPGPHPDKLTTQQLVVAQAFASGATSAEIARQFQLNRGKVDGWLAKPNFKAEIRKHIDVVIAEKVVDAAQKSLDVICAVAEELDPKKTEHFDRAIVIWDKMQNAMKRFGAAGGDDGLRVRTLNITFTTKEGEPPPVVDALYKVGELESGEEDG